MNFDKNYIITIKGDGKNRAINLSAGTFKFGVISLIIGVIIFVGSCGYSVYSALYKQRNAEAVVEVQQAGELQQEQLLTISKKAVEMDETLQNLAQQEEELRIQAGLNPPKKDEVPAENVETPPPGEGASTDVSEIPEAVPIIPDTAENHNGQGGPINELNFSDIEESLTMLEKRVAIRQESLNEFQAALKQRRETLAIAAATGTLPDSVAAGLITPLPNNVVTLDLSQFGGSPASNPNMPSIWPTTGVVTSPYGLRWGGSDFHPGMDIANDLGTPIVATADGVVEYAGWNSGGYGNMVDINHGNGIMTRYGHATQVVVSAGQAVKRGQVIAYMGSTGFSTGPHVHYEVHVNGQRVNPISYL